MPSLFQMLSYAGIASTENYLTEAFRLIINTMLEREPAHGVEFLNWLCAATRGKLFNDAVSIALQTQAELVSGKRPDIKIEAPDTLVFIEIKDWAKLSEGQLENYVAGLRSSGVKHTRLVFIYRFDAPAPITTLSPESYLQVKWNEIYEWLAAWKNAGQHDPVTAFLVQEFLAYFEERRLYIQKVQTFEEETRQASLKKMIDQAVSEIKSSLVWKGTRKSSRRDPWYCYYFPKGIWYGFRYSQPYLLLLQPINPQKLGFRFAKELDLSQSNFLDLTTQEQQKLLADFLIDSLNEFLAVEQAAHQPSR